jgi:ABC-type dipeptide/oligopeptide/nickel transport system ATPase subunit
MRRGSRFLATLLVVALAATGCTGDDGAAPSTGAGGSRGVDPSALRGEIDRRLTLVGLDRTVLNNYPIELSGGMKQRMALVLSTLLDPALLVADEVTSALDVSTQRAVAETLVGFRDRASSPA